MESIMVEEFPKIKEFSQAKIEESFKIHSVEEEGEHLECSKEKESEIEKISFQGFQVGANMMQAIQDWLISKGAFEEESFNGLTSFYKSFNKELSMLASHVLYLEEKMAVKLFTYIHSTCHDIVHDSNMKFEMQLLVFDPGGFGWHHLGFN
ncbi:hypothetical protein M9H77_23186 [Catharanthus roseus]|uniref:Uncharacterized protein n=1 Tax=Catharanthus roseus TaxID=4058 RepID=A0ACC0AWM8_CATRO|nr:hypothetical protein M9H77_23186 [Catharanthus roseus]